MIGLSLFSIFVTDIIDKPAHVHIIYYVIVSQAILASEHLSEWYQTKDIALVSQDKFMLLGLDFDITLINKLEYCTENKYKHKLRVHLEGYQFYDIELNKQQYTDQYRLFHFLKNNGLPVILVDQLENIDR